MVWKTQWQHLSWIRKSTIKVGGPAGSSVAVIPVEAEPEAVMEGGKGKFGACFRGKWRELEESLEVKDNGRAGVWNNKFQTFVAEIYRRKFIFT